MSLEGKVAFVTGASRSTGIGRSIAITLAKMGADVGVSGWSHFEGAQAVAEEIKQLGRKSFAVKMNVEDYEDVKKGIAEVKSNLGAVSILVNNAAQMGQFITISKTDMDVWHKAIYTTLFSAFHCIKETWDDMCANNWGRIVNITSVAGVMGGFGQTSYGAAKAGIIGLTKSVALEGGRFNITSNAVLVGVAKTGAPMADEVRQKLEKRILTRRLSEPQEIADAVAYLASDKAQYMTGAIMNMMGGLDLFIF
jgi:3-oxoacyl-[acyl-carrier protein] reductase